MFRKFSIKLHCKTKRQKYRLLQVMIIVLTSKVNMTIARLVKTGPRILRVMKLRVAITFHKSVPKITQEKRIKSVSSTLARGCKIDLQRVERPGFFATYWEILVLQAHFKNLQ